MRDEYLIVHKSALPDSYEKVIEAREHLQAGEAKDISEAVQMAGVSRSTYYKYRDLVFRPSAGEGGRKAIFSMLLTHRQGVLSHVLSVFSDVGANILTIMQSPPIGPRAGVVISVDIAAMAVGTGALMGQMEKLDGVERVELMDME